MPDPMFDTAELEAFQKGDAQTAIDQATQSVRDHCGWHVGPSLTEIVKVRGKGTDHVWLPSLHITSVASVTIDGSELPVGDYEWTVEGRLTRIHGWFNYGALIEVDMTHGHTPPPASVVEVIMARAARRIDDPLDNTAGVQKGPFGQQFRKVDAEAERDRLRPYRIPRSR